MKTKMQKSKDNYNVDIEHMSGPTGCHPDCPACEKELPAPLHDECSHSKPQHTPTLEQDHKALFHDDLNVQGCSLCKPQHTPTPWTPESINNVPMNSAQEKADQEFMLRAVNAHEEMLNALKWVADFADGFADHPDDAPAWIKAVRKAIAKAEGL